MDKSKLTILLDNGHSAGLDTNHSPDKKLIEGKWAREITKEVQNILTSKGFKVERIVPEDRDIPLSTRSTRVNNICDKVGKENVLLVSVHIDACDSKVDSEGWTSANHWSVWVYRACSEASKKFATAMHTSAKKHGLKVTSEPYRTAGFWIVRKTKCPAILTENLFQNNRENCKWLLSEEGKKTIVDVHVQGIEDYIKSV